MINRKESKIFKLARSASSFFQRKTTEELTELKNTINQACKDKNLPTSVRSLMGEFIDNTEKKISTIKTNHVQEKIGIIFMLTLKSLINDLDTNIQVSELIRRVQKSIESAEKNIQKVIYEAADSELFNTVKPLKEMTDFSLPLASPIASKTIPLKTDPISRKKPVAEEELPTLKSKSSLI